MVERRRFSDRERAALYLAADGRCSGCGVELQPGWHADHVAPWSRGGSTDVINGQALCPDCNRRKGARMTDLRSWQNEALARFLGSRGDFLAVATPGAGKTVFALTAVQQMIEMSEIRRVVVVVPTAHLRTQWAAAGARLGVQLDHRFANGNGVLARDFDGAVVTYAAVAQQPLLWRKLTTDQPTLVVLDEIHHGGDEQTWGSALKAAFSEATRRLLLSGTPFRSDRMSIPFVQYDDDLRCIPSYSYDYGTALIDRTVVRPIEFPALDGSVRWREAGAIISTDLAGADDETLANALQAALSPDGDWIASVLRRADQELSRHRQDVPDAGGLVIAPDQYRARKYAAILGKISGEQPTLAVSEEADASEQITRFAEGSTRWIVAVQMVSEGVDIPRLVVGVYASRIRTEMFFRQVVGRFVRMRGADDETYATLFIPSIEPLLRYAKDVEKTVGRALDERERQVRESIKEEGQTTLRLDLVEPLDSSVAVHHSTILAGESLPEDELRRAEPLHAYFPGNVTTAQIARALRAAGAGRVVASTTFDAPVARPLADQKASLRQLLNRKVGRLHRLTERPHAHIHAKLNQMAGDNAKTATVETLERRLEILDGWLEEA